MTPACSRRANALTSEPGDHIQPPRCGVVAANSSYTVLRISLYAFRSQVICILQAQPLSLLT
jgi:hypothetical protein